MRGLSRQVTNTSILPLLDGFPPHLGRRVYDFVYVPWATHSSTNIGLAFINFETHQFCKTFLDSLHKPANRKRLLAYGVRSVGQAIIQGRGGANIRAILAKRGRAGLDDSDAPLVFEKGAIISLHDLLDGEVFFPPASILRPQEQSYMPQIIAPPSPADTPIPSRLAPSVSSQRPLQQKGSRITQGLEPCQAPLICSGLASSSNPCIGNAPSQGAIASPASAHFGLNQNAPMPPHGGAGLVQTQTMLRGFGYNQPCAYPAMERTANPMQYFEGPTNPLHYSDGHVDAMFNREVARRMPPDLASLACSTRPQLFKGAGALAPPANVSIQSMMPQVPCGSPAQAAPRQGSAENWWGISQTPQLQEPAVTLQQKA
eukprot:symbB.v1.2.019642.t1/scaffold1584.1/size110534/1